MRLTPLDIRQQQFTVRMFRGLDPQEVDAFLEDVAEDYESVLKENGMLREQMTALEERSRGLIDREKALQDTLLTTQRLAEEMKESARREAQLIMREAELRGDKFVEDLRAEEARIRSDINELKRARRQVAEDLRATLDRYHRIFAADLADDGHEEDADGH
ncbi:MAG TPA: DivIVA domain-containing protein [Methylomirabilota bacterium]|jgi:cell division initiation protein